MDTPGVVMSFQLMVGGEQLTAEKDLPPPSPETLQKGANSTRQENEATEPVSVITSEWGD